MVRSPEQADARMLQIASTPSIQGDGVWWFNRAYLWSRQNVLDAADDGFFDDRNYIRRLDVHFVNYWIAAYNISLSQPANLPACWKPLFNHRNNPHTLPVQFIIAGLTAHIFRDLTLAVFEAERFWNVPLNKLFLGPHWSDYNKVNDVLERTMEDQVLPEVRDGYMGELLLGIDALLGNLSIRGSRTDAWDRGNTMRLLHPFLGTFAGSVQDEAYSVEAGLLAEAFLTPPLGNLSE